MKKKYFKNFALFRINSRSESLKLINIYDDIDIAYQMLRFNESENHKSFISFEVCPCELPCCKDSINSCLINALYNIANCLNIAERALLKSNYDYSEEWFNLAKERSIVAARYLDFVDGTEKL